MDIDLLRDKLEELRRWIEAQEYDSNDDTPDYIAALAYSADWFSEEADSVKNR